MFVPCRSHKSMGFVDLAWNDSIIIINICVVKLNVHKWHDHVILNSTSK